MFVKLRPSDQKVFDSSLKEAQHSSQRWKLEAKEAGEKVVRAEVDWDAAQHEATMARLEIEAMSGARA